MYDIFKSVIESGRYELNDMLTKIDTIWVQGDISEEEKTELVALAQEKANPENSYAPLQKQVNELYEMYETLEKRVAALEGGEPEEPEEYPEWYKWDGLGNCPWQTGSKCTHNEKKWVSKVDNNIWEPGAEGVHETIWEEVVEEQTDGAD
ncbi:MAG TPA: hypothetical protein H9740_09725 [Candidatus Hungatella pullicola]|nr:hypothetical protein [Candidatus Hungatella pullicola]